jgi:hypothetical protein
LGAITKQAAADKVQASRITDTLRIEERVAELLIDDRQDRPVPTIRTQEITDHRGVVREPTVRRASWRDPTDTSPNRREAKVVDGYRTAEALVTLQDRGGPITDLHIRAGRRLVSDYELGEAGARPGYERPEIGTQGFGPTDGPTIQRLDALRKFRQAKEAVPRPQWPIIEFVVINNGSATQYAKNRKMRRVEAVGYLLAALDCLVDHYDLRNEEKRRKAKAEKN